MNPTIQVRLKDGQTVLATRYRESRKLADGTRESRYYIVCGHTMQRRYVKQSGQTYNESSE